MNQRGRYQQRGRRSPCQRHQAVLARMLRDDAIDFTRGLRLRRADVLRLHGQPGGAQGAAITVEALPAGVDAGQADSDIRGLLTAYQAHWGFSPATDLVFLASRSGDEARAARVRQQLRAELERMSAAGLVSHGLDYLLASVAALEGDRVAALRHLEAAVRRGWRRTWWARIDPAFGDLRQDPEFVSLIERVERLP